MRQDNNNRDGFHRRALLGALGALGLSTAIGTASGTANGEGPSVSTTEADTSDDSGHDHGGDRLGADEPLMALTAKRVNTVRYANAFEGETADEKVTNAIEDLA
jgi:hypothetical protein